MPYHPIEEISGYRGKFGIVGPTGNQVAEVDPLGYLVTIDIVHHKIHEGEYYKACSVDENLSTATKWWLLINSVGSPIHGLFDFNCTVAGRVVLYEDCTTGTFNKGTLTPCFNYNRVVGGTANMLFYSSPVSLTGTGLQLYNARFGAGQRNGGELASREEIIFKTGGTYALALIPDATSGKVALGFGFYNHEV
jgi:hypothetical protein